MDYEAKIKAAQDEVSAVKDEMTAIVKSAEDENRDLSDDDSALLEVLEARGADAEKQIANWTRAEKIAGMKAVQAKAPAIIQRHGSGKDRPKGDIFFKQATLAFLAKEHRLSPQQAAAQFYPKDTEFQEVVKSVVNPAATDVATWAAELVDDSLQGFLDILRGASVGYDLLASAGISLNFDGLGSITVPTRAGTKTDMRSGWTGERSAIPVRRASTGAIVISPYKWAAISTFSKELADRSTPSIESLVRQFIVQDTATALDGDLLGDAAAVAGYRPAGLYNGVTGTASAGATMANINTDIVELVDPLIAADCWNDPVIYINPSNTLKMKSAMGTDGTQPFRAELSAGNIMGIPVQETTNVPLDELLVVDRGSIAAAVSAPMFTASDSATLVEIDDDGPNATDKPAMEQAYPRTDQSGQVGDAATWNSDALNTVKAPIRSLFQTEGVAIKTVQYLSWHRMRDECVNKITGVSY